MKLISLLPNLINIGFNYVIQTSEKYNIDESHSLRHSMEVYKFSKRILESELSLKPFLEEQKSIIFMSAIGHDMCDKKYMNEAEGIQNYKNYLSEYMSNTELQVVGDIISTMSYSKVKANGYPDLGEYQLAYHIVREADLLGAYDFDRCVIYAMHHSKLNYNEAIKESLELFDKRVLQMRKDNLFVTDFSKKESLSLHRKAVQEIKLNRI